MPGDSVLYSSLLNSLFTKVSQMDLIGGRDQDKSKEELIEEVAALRQQVVDYRHSQHSLAEKYQSYAFIVDTSRDFMTLINRDYVYEAANESYCQAHEKSREEIIGKSVAEVWGQEKFESQIKEHLDTCFSGQEAQYQDWFEFATLGRRYFDVIYYPYYGVDGTVTHAVVVSRDNTHYKHVETQLTRSEQRYRLVSDLTSNYTYAFGLGPDDQFLLEWVTDAFSRITGFAPEEVNTRYKWIQLTHPDDVFRVDRRELALLTGQMNVTEFRIVSKSGDIRWVRDHIRPIWSRKQQRVVRLYGAVQDITEQQRNRAQLIQADKLAGIGVLAAGVAHEINNPIGYLNSTLNTMKKYLDRVDKYIKSVQQGEEIDSEELNDILEDFGDAIEESIEGTGRVKEIVMDLKSFSRIDRAEKEMANLNDGIKSTLNVVWNELKYKCKVEKDFGDIPDVYCMPNQLNQVFMNLLVNAGQSIRDKEGLLKIKTWSDVDYVYVMISDNGCGIPESNLKKIFEPFFTTKDVGKGTGLGLSLVFDIIKKHNGEIDVKSEVGTGTEFLIKIPVEGINDKA